MKTSLAVFTWLSMGILSSHAIAQQAPSPVAPWLPEQASHAEIRYDRANRPVIATEMNGKGPYFMVVDTASQATLMVPQLAKLLGLTALDSDMTINGATGAVKAQFYPVDRFTSPLFDIRDVGLLALPNPGSTQAAGIIGMDMFIDKALAFHTHERYLTTYPTGQVPGNYATLKAHDSASGLLTVTVQINGIDVPALVDSGAAATIANEGVLAALGWNFNDEHLVDDGEIAGATSDVTSIKKATIHTLQLGPIKLSDVPVRFTPPRGESRPELILGNDILNLFNGYALDFPAQEFLIFYPPKKSPQH